MATKVGTDIVDISRIENSISKFGNKFLNKFLSHEEIKLANKVETIAGFWAAKEAISKALGCGIGRELNFHDIEIKKNNKNAPYFVLQSSLWNILDSSLSISHDGNFAISVVIVEIK